MNFVVVLFCFFSSEWKGAVRSAGPLVACLWPGTLQDEGRAIARYKMCYFPLLLMASGVSARSHSGSTHLLRTKRGLMGVHTTKPYSKDIGQGDSSQLPAARLATENHLPLCVCLSERLFHCTKKEKRHETAQHMKWCKTDDYISDIYLHCGMWITAWWLNSLSSLEQLKSSPPHVLCIASFQKCIYSIQAILTAQIYIRVYTGACPFLSFSCKLNSN